MLQKLLLLLGRWVRRLFRIGYSEAKTLTKGSLTEQEQNKLLPTPPETPEEKNLFDALFSKPLDQDQRSAVLDPNRMVTVIAGAGSGKTSVMVAKVAHLVKIKGVSPSKILLISFTNSACEELKQRIFEKVGVEVAVKTIHKLGLDLIKQVTQVPVRISFENTGKVGAQNSLGKVITDIMDRCYLEDPEFKKEITHFFRHAFQPAIPPEEFKTFEDWQQYHEALGQIFTLSNHKVRSVEERMIADFLYENQIHFEYEPSYKTKVPTAKLNFEYKPDFFIPGANVFLEHFALDRNGKAPLWFKDKLYEKRYAEKLTRHNEYKSDLIVSYSYQFQDDTWRDNLTQELNKRGISLNPRPTEYLKQEVSERYITNWVSLVCKFLPLYKIADYGNENPQVQNDRITSTGNYFYTKRNKSFLKVFRLIYGHYEEQLKKQGACDFSDMIVQSKRMIENKQNKIEFPYSHLMVDEFQDTSQGMMNLIQALDSRFPFNQLLFVGDDWQSIYRFNGADVSIMKETSEKSSVKCIRNNYRSHENIVCLGANFVTKNKNQMMKSVRSASTSSVKTNFSDSFICQTEIASSLTNLTNMYGLKSATVFLLTRYNQDIVAFKKELSILRSSLKDLKIEILTIHESKGREADFVVLLPPVQLPFPLTRSEDPILEMVKARTEPYPFAEERRLLYVAITRARFQVLFAMPTAAKTAVDKESVMKKHSFIQEIAEEYGIDVIEQIRKRAEASKHKSLARKITSRLKT